MDREERVGRMLFFRFTGGGGRVSKGDKTSSVPVAEGYMFCMKRESVHLFHLPAARARTRRAAEL